jgi:putative heme-binding domain-containing protein
MTPNSLLESILNPSTDIKQGYETVLITQRDGQIRSGLLHRKTNTATLLRLPSGEIASIPEQSIQQTDVSPVSLMPAGLTRNLHEDELRDLLAYLISLGQAE